MPSCWPTLLSTNYKKESCLRIIYEQFELKTIQNRYKLCATSFF